MSVPRQYLSGHWRSFDIIYAGAPLLMIFTGGRREMMRLLSTSVELRRCECLRLMPTQTGRTPPATLLASRLAFGHAASRAASRSLMSDIALRPIRRATGGLRFCRRCRARRAPISPRLSLPCSMAGLLRRRAAAGLITLFDGVAAGQAARPVLVRMRRDDMPIYANDRRMLIIAVVTNMHLPALYLFVLKALRPSPAAHRLASSHLMPHIHAMSARPEIAIGIPSPLPLPECLRLYYLFISAATLIRRSPCYALGEVISSPYRCS